MQKTKGYTHANRNGNPVFQASVPCSISCTKGGGVVETNTMFPRSIARHWPALIAFLITSLMVWILLPGMVVALDDDFWYLRSVIKTIQKGRPWTDDWLTPWAASCSVISAGIFKLTGSFTLAIHLQLSAAAGLAGAALTIFLKRQGNSSLKSVSTTVLLLLCPTVLFMFLMFTGVALYLACLWWCLLLAEKRRWVWFFLPWAVALASRQSAIVWLALPGWHWLTACWQNRSLIPRDRDHKILTALLPAAGLYLLLVRQGMNPTPAQQLVTAGLQGAIASGRGFLSIAMGLTAAGAGLAVTSLLRLPQVWAAASSRQRRVRVVLLPVFAVIGGLALPWFVQVSLNTHDCYRDEYSTIWIPLLGVALGAALALGGTRPSRPDALLAGTGSVLLISIYAGTFDYYYIEVFSFALAAAWPAAPPRDPETSPSPSISLIRFLYPAATILLIGGTCLWHARSLIRLASQQDRAAGIITLYEQNLRQGRIAPQDIGMSTFGYHGWLFQDYYAAHEGQQNPLLGGFTRYGQTWNNTSGTGILTTYPKAFKDWRGVIPTRNNAALKAAPNLKEIGSLEAPFLHFFTVRYQLLRGSTAGPLEPGKTPDPAIYQRIPFPLNDAEWLQLIKESPPL